MAARPPVPRGDTDATVELRDTAHGTEVRLPGAGLAFRHSFVRGELARRCRESRQALLRAVNNRQRQVQSVLDATAGWGADALTLARHGYAVTMVEREARVRQVLQRALDCLARADGELAARLRLIGADAGDLLRAPGESTEFDCILIDPMFPAHKSGAKPAKPMQVLQALARAGDADELLLLARRRARYRVVVKRPAKAAALAGTKPDLVYREKSVRFDVYLAATAQLG